MKYIRDSKYILFCEKKHIFSKCKIYIMSWKILILNIQKECFTLQKFTSIFEHQTFAQGK